MMLLRVIFAAEQRNSLGKVWHPGCLRCEECGKRLNPGQHSEVSEVLKLKQLEYAKLKPARDNSRYKTANCRRTKLKKRALVI